VEIVISPQGEARIETKGFAGANCRAASQWLEVALGVRTAEQLTADFHARSSESTQLHEGA
jgi:hypothetical protein